MANGILRSLERNLDDLPTIPKTDPFSANSDTSRASILFTGLSSSFLLKKKRSKRKL